MSYKIRMENARFSLLGSLFAMTILVAFLLVMPAAGHAADNSAIATASASRYSPYAGREYPTQVYFGDTHHHTANSGDAFMNGDRLSPEDAYRFARGEEVVSSTGIPVKLARPLDFLVISDHAEGLGVMYEVYNGNPVMMADETLARWNKMMKAGGDEAASAQNELVSAQAQGTLPGPVTNPEIAGPLQKTVWQAYTETAEQYNDPGRVTSGPLCRAAIICTVMCYFVIARTRQIKLRRLPRGKARTRKTCGNGWPTMNKRPEARCWPFHITAISLMAACLR
jgi:hypothetical protein